MNHPRIQLVSEHGSSCPPIFIINLDRRIDRLNRVLLRLKSYKGAVYRYQAIDTRDPGDLVYAKSLDPNCLNWSSWQRGIGGFGNRFSHVDLIGYLSSYSRYEIYCIAEDDVEFRSSSYAMRALCSARNDLIEAGADVAILSGWDYKPKIPSKKLRFPFINYLAKCYCTLGTQLNVYTLSGGMAFMQKADGHPGLHLDESIARLQAPGDLNCIGYLKNPFSCFLDISDVEYINGRKEPM